MGQKQSRMFLLKTKTFDGMRIFQLHSIYYQSTQTNVVLCACKNETLLQRLTVENDNECSRSLCTENQCGIYVNVEKV